MEARLPWRSDARYHLREAVHFRELAKTVTTARLKARLLEQALEHERKARGKPATAFIDERPRGGRPIRF
jgi:hypothetical protein